MTHLNDIYSTEVVALYLSEALFINLLKTELEGLKQNPDGTCEYDHIKIKSD